ncbi:anaphase-promoting complex subunit 5 [Marchantia polymorpha subsp. ruderalis]
MAGAPSRFVLTPHKLVMCILLNAVAAPRQGSTSLVALPLSSRHRLARLLLDFVKASASLLEPTYEELEHSLEKALGTESGFSEELHSLLKSFATPEDLFNLFLSLRELLASSPRPNLITSRGDGDQLSVDLSSTLGLFLRRCSLSFNELSFEQVCRLLRELKHYRELSDTVKSSAPPDSTLVRYFQQHQFLDEGIKEETSSSAKLGLGGNTRGLFGGLRESVGGDIFEARQSSGLANRDGASTGIRSATPSGETTSKRHFLRTSGEVEAYLSEQAVILETKRSFEKDFTDGLVTRLSELKELASHIPQVHYVQYLNYLFQKDYPAAMESLHRFFDFSAGEVFIPGSVTQYESGIGRLQAGLLGLGHMHSHMGHITMALQALNESILIAQQNNDNHCLLHALAALCNLFSEVGVYTDDDERCKWITHPGLDPEYKFYPAPEQHFVGLLKRCLRRALELRLPQLIGFSRLAIAKIKLQHVHKIAVVARMRNSLQFGTSPLEVCKILRVNQCSLGNVDSNGFRMSPSTPHGRNSHADLTSVGQVPAISGALSVTSWGWWKPQLKWLARSMLKLGGTSQLLRASSWEHYGSEPLVRASTLVHIACYADASSADDLSLAYIKLVKLQTNLRGYSAGCDSLVTAAKRFPLLSKSRVRALELQCTVERALYQGETEVAQVANGELLALASIVSGVDMGIKIQASVYKAQIQLAVCQYKEAAISTNRLFSLCFKGNMQQDSINLLLLMADIYKKAGNAVTGLPYVLAGLTLCQSLNLDLLQASAMVTLAELWIGLGMFPGRRGLVLLQQCMPVVLGHGSLELRARANFAVAQCYLSDPGFSVKKEPRVVLQPLQAAVSQAQQIEHTELTMESLYLHAVVLDSLGLIDERDQAAAAYQRCVMGMQVR